MSVPIVIKRIVKNSFAADKAFAKTKVTVLCRRLQANWSVNSEAEKIKYSLLLFRDLNE